MGDLAYAAISLDHLSIVYWMLQYYNMLSQLKDALQASIKACSTAEKSWIDPTTLACIQFNYGRCLFKFSRYTEALPILKKSLSAFEYMGNGLRTAGCLEALGIIHASQGDSHETVEMLEGAIEKYIELGEISVRGRCGIERCRDNLDRIKRREGSGEENMSLDLYIFM